MATAKTNVNAYLKNEFKILIANPYFDEWVDAHAGYSNPPATNFIIQNLHDFVNEEKEYW